MTDTSVHPWPGLMPNMNALQRALQHELDESRRNRQRGEFVTAFGHLERAHILSQRITLRHVRVHVEMLKLGWAQRDFREVLGQLPRIVAAALFSRIWVPAGNTGGARISAFKPMPIPADLQALLQASRSPPET